MTEKPAIAIQRFQTLRPAKRMAAPDGPVTIVTRVATAMMRRPVVPPSRSGLTRWMSAAGKIQRVTLIGMDRPTVHWTAMRNNARTRRSSWRAKAALKRGAIPVLMACMSRVDASVNRLSAA